MIFACAFLTLVILKMSTFIPPVVDLVKVMKLAPLEVHSLHGDGEAVVVVGSFLSSQRQMGPLAISRRKGQYNVLESVVVGDILSC